MAVHASLLSLNHTLDNLIHNDNGPIIPLMNDDEGQQIIKHLHESISFLQSFLEQDGKETNVDSSFKRRIRDAAYHAEDVIESYIMAPPSGSKRRVWRWISEFGKEVLPRKLTDRLIKRKFQKVMEGIDLIVKKAKKMTMIKNRFISIEELQHQSSGYSFGVSPSRQPPPKMIGLSEEELLKIKDWLCGDSSSLRVISIVGMGGTGKTTLAHNLFDDALIVHHFHKRAWSTISQRYQNRNILLELLHSLTEKSREEDLSQLRLQKTEEEMLAEKVYKSLKGRRYLIVMDDMWRTEAWHYFRRIFPNDGNGSRVIITTRELHLAAYVDDSLSHVHHMKFLDGDQSWELLRDKVFAHRSCPQELEISGRKIAARCEGLPLGIVLVAGLLTKVPRRARDWEKFAECVSSKLAADDNEVFSKIMSLSYNHLPHHLKPCFLYMGAFPEDYEMPVFNLLQIWIAEGFVRRPTTGMCLEEAAEEYLNDLVKRNLLPITKKSTTGKSKKCRIHDLLREFCVKKAKDENFFCHDSEERIWDKRRRLFLFHRGRLRLTSNEAANLRSLIVSASSFDMTDFSSRSILSRVFEGLETQLISIPQLLHLRYLSFMTMKTNVFPASISRLRNLNTIILRNYRTNVYLPFEIWRMPQLRHLIFQNKCFLPCPSRIASGHCEKASCLQNLQTLSKNIVNFTFNQERIALIPNLKKLGVYYSCGNWSQFGLHNLHHLHQLESLHLTVVRLSDFHRNISFPSTLGKLVLSGGKLPWEKMTVIGSLPNLQVLKLRQDAFVGDEWLTTDGEFPQLKHLLMEYIWLMHWRTESSHFPRLERLIIRHCWSPEIPSAIGEIPTLQLIEVVYGSEKSTASSGRRIQQEQHDMGNDYLRVRILKEKSYNW